MEFVIHKYAEIVFKTGKWVNLQNLILYFNREIQELELVKTYKYLGIEESEGTKQQVKD